MSLPVRCFTCNKVIGQYEQKFEDMVEQGFEINDILNRFGLSRYCCRRMFLGHVPVLDNQLPFPKDIESLSEKKSKTER
jgi:DNA-directed RNA polymerase subunit N (RpoN/RPB10)